MRKYLELFKDGFDATIAEKIKPENRPYVGYSPSEGVKFTVIPAPVVGPADNEIWYTSRDGNVVTPSDTNVFGANIVSNTYENGKGVITCDGEVTCIGRYAFDGCSGLTSITISNSVTSIGGGAFLGCSGLNYITYEGTQEQWNSITKGVDWNYNVPATVVHCADGDLPI